MKNYITYLLIVPLLSILTAQVSYSNDVEDHQVQQYIHNITSAAPPKAINEYLIFSQNPQKYTRYVGAAFEHEDYNEIHVFQKNRYGIFFYVYPISKIPHQLDYITYRIVEDGLWMTDPQVQEFTRDHRGVRLSVLPVETPGPSTPKETVSLGNGIMWFYFKAPQGSHVTVIGDFNNWNPFSNPMKETAPGEFSTQIRTSPGIHTYTYVINGRHADVNKIEIRPEHRVYVHTLGIRAVKITVE